MPGYVIRVIGYAAGPSPFDGQFVADYTPHGHGGRGSLTTTPDPMRAKVYADQATAMLAWREQSKTHPLRPGDGKPNRPLTAFTCEFLPLSDFVG